MRLCPTVEGSPSPLITHRIGADTCQARQGAFFHKCHRCIYRGKAADWEPEQPPHLTIEVEGREAGDHGPGRNGVGGAPRRPAAPGRDRGAVPGTVAEAEA